MENHAPTGLGGEGSTGWRGDISETGASSWAVFSCQLSVVSMFSPRKDTENRIGIEVGGNHESANGQP